MDATYVCQTALVTGGASGIGRATVERLARDGVRVFVADIDAGAAVRLASDVVTSGGAAEAFAVDVSDSTQVGRLFTAVRNRCERLDLLVHCVGILGETSFIEETTDDAWERMIAVNLSGTFYCCREAVRWMALHRRGRIVNVCSVAALMPTPGALAYSASKGGVAQLTKTLASEVARHNIRVNAVAPGYVETPILEAMDETFKEKTLRRTPLKRFGRPEEIADLIGFLASPGADFFTGQILSPNGGLVI